MLEKRAINVVKDQKGFLNYLFLVQKNRGATPYCESKGIKRVSEIPTFQDGRHSFSKGPDIIQEKDWLV